MRNLNPVMRNSAVSGRDWKIELDLFLRNYRATPHSSTRIAPEQLLFKTLSSTSRLPNFLKSNLPKSQLEIDDSARFNDELAKNRMKVNMDAKLKVTVSQFCVGDRVLLSNNNGPFNKSNPRFDPVHFTITHINGSMLTAQRSDKIVTRNSSFFKKIPIEEKDFKFEPIPIVRANPTQNGDSEKTPAEAELDDGVGDVEEVVGYNLGREEFVRDEVSEPRELEYDFEETVNSSEPTGSESTSAARTDSSMSSTSQSTQDESFVSTVDEVIQESSRPTRVRKPVSRYDDVDENERAATLKGNKKNN